ncbi:peptidylprolyl isomerase, partial [Thermodesulfobacteriota bacterium]
DATPEKEKEVREKAAAVLEKAKQGEDFAKLAEEYSEGPTKTNGGDLGYFPKGTLYEEFDDAAFSLEKGEISDLVKSPVGYHIIKVDDIMDNPVVDFKEVRDQIASIMTRNSSMDLANEKALSLIDQMPYDVDLAEYASQHDVPIESTDLFARFEPPELFQGNSKLLETLFALANKDISELIELNNEYYIMQIIDKKASYLPELNEVMAAVEIDYIEDMALKQAKREAEKYLQELKEGKDWIELAKEKYKIPDTADYFSRLDFPDKIGTAPGLHEAAFKLDMNSPYPDKVFENYSGAYVIKFEEKQQIDKSKFNEEKNRYSEALMLRKQQAIFSSWIERMKAKSDIDRSYFDSLR